MFTNNMYWNITIFMYILLYGCIECFCQAGRNKGGQGWVPNCLPTMALQMTPISNLGIAIKWLSDLGTA